MDSSWKLFTSWSSLLLECLILFQCLSYHYQNTRKLMFKYFLTQESIIRSSKWETSRLVHRFQVQVLLQLWAIALMNMDAWFHGDNKIGGTIGASQLFNFFPTQREAYRSRLTVIKYSHPLVPVWHAQRLEICWAFFTMAFGMREHNAGRDGTGWGREKKEKRKKVEKDWSKQTNQTW